MRKNFIAIDLETTGFTPLKGCKIIEIAAVKVEDGVIVERKSQLIDPEIEIPQHITAITGISDDMVKGKPTVEEVLPKFHEFIGDSVIVAHNARFDWNTFLVHCFGELGITPRNKVVCTLELSKRHIRSSSHKLGELCNHLGIRLENAHRALGDAEATAHLMNHLVDIAN